MNTTSHIHDKTIAVLPFVNRSASEENEYFSDGITEEIINALAKIEGLKVTSRTSSFSFKGTNKTILEIAKQLNVAIILIAHSLSVFYLILFSFVFTRILRRSFGYA